MLQFTEQEIQCLRKRAERNPEMLHRMKEEIQDVMGEELCVPKKGIANWSLYYYCPDCSVALTFCMDSPYTHRCPCCKKEFSGEPYDSSWWGQINERNYTNALKMAYVYLITGEKRYAAKAIDIMCEYAKYYKDYEVHGDIPYNGPGKAGAQTLDEANFLRTYAIVYDLTSGEMTEAERYAIRENMLLPGADFLMEHRHKQLHNHEVIISAAIAVTGLLFGKEDYIKCSVYEPYGILYQLEHGMGENRIWFEGSFAYHFYALMSFFAFEKFALHTKHSHIKHPNYKAMLEVPFDYMQPGGEIPMLNDTNYGHEIAAPELYEFGFREIGGEKIGTILNVIYKGKKRENQETLIYGTEQMPEILINGKNYHTELGKPGHTVLHGANGRFLLFKHDAFGGEHDHYDRLGLSYLAYGKRIAADLGTSGYGAVMHYEFYKNTGSHNTVTIGEENQSPVNAVLTAYKEKDDIIYAEAEADWRSPYTPPDSFTIVQWKAENYRTVKMKRKIAWADDFFAELFLVEGAASHLPIDWSFHISGKRVSDLKGQVCGRFSQKKPFYRLHDMLKAEMTEGVQRLAFQDEDIITEIFCMEYGQDIYCGKGPDNPSNCEINYLIERMTGGKAVFAHVIATSQKESDMETVLFKQEAEKLSITVKQRSGKCRKIHFAMQ